MTIETGFNELFDALMDTAQVNVEYAGDDETIEAAQQILHKWAHIRYRHYSVAELIEIACRGYANENPYAAKILTERGY